MVRLPVNRQDQPAIEICLHVSSAPFGFDIIVGTNALDQLGLKLYDAISNRMIDFECVDLAKATSDRGAKVIFNTKLQPWSMSSVELALNDLTLERKEHFIRIRSFGISYKG